MGATTSATDSNPSGRLDLQLHRQADCTAGHRKVAGRRCDHLGALTASNYPEATDLVGASGHRAVAGREHLGHRAVAFLTSTVDHNLLEASDTWGTDDCLARRIPITDARVAHRNQAASPELD